MNASEFPKGWEAQKPLVERALGRLQRQHPDILFTADYVNVGPCFGRDLPGYDSLPDNLQVADHHIYTLGIQKALHDLTNTWLGQQIPPRSQRQPATVVADRGEASDKLGRMDYKGFSS